VDRHSLREDIEVTHVGEHSYAVAITGRASTSAHRVVVPPALLSKLGLVSLDEARLVRASFEFLLEREPASAILPRFDLDVIGQYFPEFLGTIRSRLDEG
jgi:hypothetical protein